MKRTIAALVAGIVLGATGVAAAGQNYYWSEHGKDYHCEGISPGLACTAGNYQVGVTQDYVYVQHRRTKQTFGCRKRAAFIKCSKS